MATEQQVRFVANALRTYIYALYRSGGQISRKRRLSFEQLLRRRQDLRALASQLYGPTGEAPDPKDPTVRLVRLNVLEIGGRRRSLIVIRSEKRGAQARRRRRFRCLVGHRFTRKIEEAFRWNLREVFEVFGIDPIYSGFDGRAVQILNDLCNRIRTSDFCLFDNRETTQPSKPNVYIEAGMAFALKRPFIFCHYKREVWSTNFSNLLYISYENYQDLFQKICAALPLFLRQLNASGRTRRRH